MASVRKLAEKAGVSIATVSRVLNGGHGVNPDTREAVLMAANDLSYVPGPSRRTANQIGFVYTQEMTIAHPYDSAVLAGAVRGLGEAHVDVSIISLQGEKRADESFTQLFRRKGVKGVLIRTMAGTRDICQAIADEGFPHVVVSERYDSTTVNCIDGESYSESVRAVEYLASLGHRCIAFGMHSISDRDHSDRHDGYREGLERCGIPYDDRLVFRYPFTLAGGATILNMIVAMKPRPTAIYFADPMMSVGAVKRAHELGVVIPRDLSIVGFDDTDIRFAVHPTLTAVCQDAEMLGYQAARWLTRAIANGTKESLHELMSTYFEVNQSTGPAPLN